MAVINLLMGICSVFQLAMVRIMCHSSRHFHEFRLKIALLGGTSHDKRGKTWRVGGSFAPTEQRVEIHILTFFSLSLS